MTYLSTWRELVGARVDARQLCGVCTKCLRVLVDGLCLLVCRQSTTRTHIFGNCCGLQLCRRVRTSIWAVGQVGLRVHQQHILRFHIPMCDMRRMAEAQSCEEKKALDLQLWPDGVTWEGIPDRASAQAQACCSRAARTSSAPPLSAQVTYRQQPAASTCAHGHPPPSRGGGTHQRRRASHRWLALEICMRCLKRPGQHRRCARCVGVHFGGVATVENGGSCIV